MRPAIRAYPSRRWGRVAGAAGAGEFESKLDFQTDLGAKESFTVSGVPANAKYFVVVSFDDLSNRSALSNVAEAGKRSPHFRGGRKKVSSCIVPLKTYHYAH